MKQIHEIVKAQQAFFDSGATKSVAFRRDSLARLKKAVSERETDIADALYADLGKSAFEAYVSETGLVLDEAGYAMRNIRRWAKPRRVPTPLMHFWSTCRVHKEPYGVALIMTPWNYPFMLNLAPLIGAIAAGNCAVVKPSAYAPATSALIAAMVRDTFDEDYITVIEGGRDENTALLGQPFDCIFFTGSVSVGKVVMAAAAKTLAPVTLELGGKSPCIVDETADVALAARRIVWGKFLNAGQTCVAPDYVLAHADIKDALISHMSKEIARMYGDDPLQNAEFPRIVNDKHFNRLAALIGGDVVHGGGTDAAQRKIAPTIIDNVSWDDAVMADEIFGPILPVLTFRSIDDAVGAVKARPKPLALYLFSQCKLTQRRIVSDISFGGGCINDTIVHLAVPGMPFGGVGQSGMGAYHGKAGFDAFSRDKSVLKKTTLFDIALRYPPYANHLGLIKKVLK